ncbi:MAG: ComEC/Rec2 family competence protein [Hydrogenothermaceae bacterium]|nr:ComEC/Rec2 family competence protein [Hydrogenothermaceae bacterium]
MIYPWLYLFIALSSGVTINSFLNIHTPYTIPILVLSLTLFFRDLPSYILLVVSSFLIGLSVSYKDNLEIDKKDVFVECISTQIPTKYKNYQMFSCKVVGSEVPQLKGKSLEVRTDQKDIFLLSRVIFIGNVVSEDGRIKAFPRKGFIKVDNSSNYIFFIKEFKDSLIERYRYTALSEDTLYLGLGLIFGERSSLGLDEYQRLVKSGLAHILAISGSHIAMLIIILNFSLFFLPIWLRYSFIAALLPLYALFTGLSIPVVRASLMGVVFSVSKIKYFKFNSLNVLFLIAYLYVLVFPESLFSVSFQLSFIAALGIILGMEIFKDKSLVIIAFGTSWIATLFTIPVVMLHFGNVSLNSILSTPIASIPLYPYLYLAFINVFTGFTLEPLVKLMDLFGVLFLQTAYLFENLPFYYTGFNPSVVFINLFYITSVVFLLSDLRVSQKVFVVSLFAVVFAVFSKVEKKDFRVYSFKGKDYPVVVVVAKDRCYLITDFPVYKQLNVLGKEGCREKTLITEKLERFPDDYTSTFDNTLPYIYEVRTKDFLLKKWVEYRVYKNSTEYRIKNQDALVDF